MIVMDEATGYLVTVDGHDGKVATVVGGYVRAGVYFLQIVWDEARVQCLPAGSRAWLSHACDDVVPASSCFLFKR